MRFTPAAFRVSMIWLATSMSLNSVKWMGHILRTHPRVKLFPGDKTEPEGRLAQAHVLPKCGKRNLRGLLISYMRIKGGHQHERMVEVFLDALFVWLDSHGAALREGAAGI